MIYIMAFYLQRNRNDLVPHNKKIESMKYSTCIYFLALLFLNGCNIFNSDDDIGCVDISEKDLPEEGIPTQYCIEEAPEIKFVHKPESIYIVQNEPALKFQVTYRDSTPHTNWLPTSLLVETDQGFSEEINLIPFACIIPIENSPEQFPFNVEWWSCHNINVNNAEILSISQIEEIEELINGRLISRREFKTMEGEQYLFELQEIGQFVINQAIEKIINLSYIQPVESESEEHDVSHAPKYPICWLDDRIPPLPCPPWELFKIFRISLEGERKDHIPVQEGGWVKASYTQPDGTVKSTTFTIPEIDQE